MPAGMERVVFYRERGALPYDPFAYGVAIALVEVPYLILQVSSFCHLAISRCCSWAGSADIPRICWLIWDPFCSLGSGM